MSSLKMTAVVIAAIVSAVAGALHAQEPAPRAGFLYWQYADDEIARAQVELFSISVDKGPYIHVTVAASKSVTPGWYEWKLPPLALGEHTFSIQACNPVECSPAFILTKTKSVTPAAVTRGFVGPLDGSSE